MFQPQALPDIGNKVSKLEEEAAILDASGKVLSGLTILTSVKIFGSVLTSLILSQAEATEYHNLQLDIAQHEKKLMSEIIRPERVLCFLDTGRLVSFHKFQILD